MRYILVLLLISFSAVAQNVKTYIPVQAPQYFDIIKAEQKRLFPELTYHAYFASLIEVESCQHLKHSRCWNPKSRLKSKREEGAGLGQLTKAYNADGSIRFDLVTELRKKHYSELKELSWDNIYTRPDLQIRSMMILSRTNFNGLYSIKDPWEKLAMTDASYNGGLPGLQKERRACSLAKGCDPNKWFNNVEDKCMKSKKPLYGNRSACMINREHVQTVLYIRMPKYEQYFK